MNADGRRAQETEEGAEAVGIWAMACFSHSVGAPAEALPRAAFCGSICRFQKSLTETLELERLGQQGMSTICLGPTSSPRASAGLPAWKREAGPGLPDGHLAGLLKALLCSLPALLGHAEKTLLPAGSLGMPCVSCRGPGWPVESSCSLSLAHMPCSLSLR